MSRIFEDAKAKIKDRKLKLVMPEGNDPRIHEAAILLQREQLAEPILFTGRAPEPTRHAIKHVLARRPNLEDDTARRLLAKPLYAAASMVATGDADALLAGVENPTSRVIAASLLIIGLKEGFKTPSSFFLMQWPDRQLIFADCAVNVQPDSEQLADIAIASALSAVAILCVDPLVAFLSFSTQGSAQHADVEKVTHALHIARLRAPFFNFDGEFQADTALSAASAAKKLKMPSKVAGQANVLIFPDLDAGNIAYKIAQYLGGAKAVGPILQGFAKPVSDVSRGASVAEIVDTAVLLLAMV